MNNLKNRVYKAMKIHKQNHSIAIASTKNIQHVQIGKNGISFHKFRNVYKQIFVFQIVAVILTAAVVAAKPAGILLSSEYHGNYGAAPLAALGYSSPIATSIDVPFAAHTSPVVHVPEVQPYSHDYVYGTHANSLGYYSL